MEQLHKKNLRIVWAGVGLLCLTSVVAYGLSFEALNGAVILVIAGIVATLGYKFCPNDLGKALFITVTPSIATFFFSYATGGNAIPFLATYVCVAMMAIYFDRKYIVSYIVPVGILSVIVLIFKPSLIDGVDYTWGGAITKVLLLFVVAAVIVAATTRGQQLLDEAEKNLEQVRTNSTTANGIAGNLNKAIVECKNGVGELVEQASSVAQATDQMSQTVESTTQSTIHVNEKITKAGEEIDQNFEMTKKVEESFRDVTNAVQNGNDEAGNVRESLKNMSVTVASAKESTDALVNEMDRITGILEEINSIASQTNLLSLNASIEAARAGEQGRGFAVVADQIRVLAEQSSTASDNIKKILDGLVGTTTEASEKINAGAKAADDGVEKMEALLSLFSEISDSACQAESVVQQEYDVMNAVKKDFEEIHNEIETLVSTNEENTAMIQNIADNIDRQHDSVENVKTEIQGISGLSDNLRNHFTEE